MIGIFKKQFERCEDRNKIVPKRGSCGLYPRTCVSVPWPERASHTYTRLKRWSENGIYGVFLRAFKRKGYKCRNTTQVQQETGLIKLSINGVIE